jgi:putative YhdH/YhfP family quinone oxidoreductase
MERCGQHPQMGEVVVSGASGGVGSMAVALLAKAGYNAVASSGKVAHYDWLQRIGATRCISRQEISDQSGKPLLSPRWAGAIDNVGGNTLSTLLKGCAKEGCVASIGLVESPKFDISVYPFILNGVNLLGVDSAETKTEMRKTIWNKLANEWRVTNLNEMKTIVRLEDIIPAMERMIQGDTTGRIVAKI